MITKQKLATEISNELQRLMGAHNHIVFDKPESLSTKEELELVVSEIKKNLHKAVSLGNDVVFHISIPSLCKKFDVPLKGVD